MRNAVVTGGSKGIGYGIAACLLRKGYVVTITGRNEQDLRKAETELGLLGPVRGVVADSTVEEDVERVMALFDESSNALSVLVNNAGIADYKSILKMDIGQWRRMIDTNLTGVFLATQRAAHRMRTTGGGAIVNIGSIDAHGMDGRQSAYGAAKAGVVNFTKTAAVELAPYGIRVNCVSPGWTATAMVGDYLPPKAMEHIQNGFSRVPMGRLVKVEEVANAVAFLASDEASGVTGVDLNVDCGVLANLYIAETLPRD